MYLIVRHKIKDYAQWKPVFDDSEEDRRKAGLTAGWITHTASDPNDLVLIFSFEDADKVRQFMRSDRIRDAMARAGVIGEPEILFLDEIERISEPVATEGGGETDWL